MDIAHQIYRLNLALDLMACATAARNILSLFSPEETHSHLMAEARSIILKTRETLEQDLSHADG